MIILIKKNCQNFFRHQKKNHMNIKICRICEVEERFVIFSYEDVETGLHCTPETFLSCIHCRFSLATLPHRTFSRLPGITIRLEKFRDRFDRHDSQVLAPHGLISINCGVTLPWPSTATRCFARW